MARAATTLSLGTEFDEFLFAPIGEEKNGMLLSVLSALARLDLDPWREAAELAQLPRESAIRRFASLIEALPSRQLAGPEVRTIAARLVALLPRVISSPTASRSTPMSCLAFVFVVLLNLLIAAGMIGAERVAASFHLSAEVGGAQSLAVSPVRAEGLPPEEKLQ